MEKQVVGIAFCKDGKLLIAQSVKSAKRNKYTLIGGKVEAGETLKQAAVRECEEELSQVGVITNEQLQPILNFKEVSASDPTIAIEMHLFLAHKKLEKNPSPNEEIVAFHWYSLDEDDSILSNSIKDHLLPYLKDNKLMY